VLVLELYFFAMADAAVDSVTALSKLLETQDGVDRLVHLEAVKKTLGALSFTVDQALHVSAAISGCAGFDENEKKSLQQLVTKQMEGTRVLTDKTRSKSQDWSRMDHFLTESIWQALEQKPFRDAMDRIICHLWRLGLRNPSEGSKAWITALLLLYQPSKTPFELRSTFTTVKEAWNSASKRLKKSEHLAGVDPPHILTLPDDPEQLSEDAKRHAYGSEKPCPSKAKGPELLELYTRIPQRTTRLELRDATSQSAVQRSSATHAQASEQVASMFQAFMPMMLQSMQAIMMHKNRDNHIDLQFTNSETSKTPCAPPRALTAGVPAEPASSSAAEKIPPPSSASLAEKKAAHDFRTASEEKLSNLVGGAAVPAPLAILDKPVPQATVEDPPQVESDEARKEKEEKEKQLEPGQSLLNKLTQRDDKKKAKKSSKMKRPAAAKAAPMQKPASAKPAKPALKMHRDNVCSRAWHKEYYRVFKKNKDDDMAKRLASKARAKAAKAWDENKF